MFTKADNRQYGHFQVHVSVLGLSVQCAGAILFTIHLFINVSSCPFVHLYAQLVLVQFVSARNISKKVKEQTQVRKSDNNQDQTHGWVGHNRGGGMVFRLWFPLSLR